MAGRGCIGQCVFCSLSSNRIRMRSIANVLDEIEQMIAITGSRYVTFADPSLTAGSKYLTELCEEILRRNLNIKWRCYSRADVPPKVMKTALKAAGLIGKGLYGVDLKQSGNQVYVIEVNDNPSIDAGLEDEVLKDELYRRIMATFLERIEKGKKPR